MMSRDLGSTPDKSGIYLVFDWQNSPCGITDRLKTAVGLYYVARIHGVGFHIIHEAGFGLRDYLAPNRVPWSAERGDILPGHERIRYLAPYDDFPEFRHDRQYVCDEYVGNNLLEKWGVPDWQRVWRELFWELFTPTEVVRKALAAEALPDRFVAVVLRFINSLGHTEDVGYNEPLDAKGQERLVEAALWRVAACVGESDSPAIVYSDSTRFLRAAAECGFVTTDVNGVGNIMNEGVGDYVTLRTFVNMLQMARAERVYSILHIGGFPENSLYKTQYPRYAAIIGDRPFVRC